MSLEIYKPIAEQPTPDQMFAMAAIAFRLAKEQGKQKHSKRADHAHILLPRAAEMMSRDEDGGSIAFTHRFIGRVEKPDWRRWKLLLEEPFWVNTSSEMASYRSYYRFEWTTEQVVRAAKKVTLEMAMLDDKIGAVSDEPLSIDHLMQPDFMHAVNEVETMSAADCSQLIVDLRTFSARSVEGIRYNRPSAHV